MKNYHKLFLLLLIFSLFSTIGSGQKNYNWDNTPILQSSIPDQYSDADAIVISDYEERQSLFETPHFFTRVIFKRRIKIQSALGLEKYGRIIIPKKKNLQITVLDTRTIKQDGTIVDLDAKDIKSLEVNPTENIFDTDKYLLFAVPGIEVGDEFEIVCIYEGRTIETGENIYLHSTLPVLQSSFVLEVVKDIVVHTSNFNGMPEPSITKTLSTHKFKWELNNLSGLYDERCAILPNTIPYFIYELILDRFYNDSAPPSIKNWRDLLLYINKNSLNAKVRKKKALAATYQKMLGDNITSSDIEKAKTVHQYINKHIQLVKSIPEKEQSNGIEFFIDKGKADYPTLLKIYKTIFKKIGLDYYLASAKSRYFGKIKLNFPSTVQITDYLFVIEDENNIPIIFTPKTKYRTFEINEVPPHLEGTNMYMVNLKDKNTFKEVQLSYSSHKKNRRTRKIQSTVDLTKNTIEHNCQENFTGAVSLEIRYIFDDALANNRLYQLVDKLLTDRDDTAQLNEVTIADNTTVAPYNYGLKYDYSIATSILEIDSNLYKINLNNWFPHVLHKVNIENRQLDYHPLFMGVDAFSYYLSFNEEVELVNKENIDFKISNDVGVFEISFLQVKPNMIGIRSKYIIKSSKIAVEDIQQLSALNEAAKNAGSEGVIFQTKK